VADGTSADAQLAVYRQARDKGAEREEALAAVSQWLAGMTLGRDDRGQHLRPRTSYLRPPAAGIHPESCTFHAPGKRRGPSRSTFNTIYASDLMPNPVSDRHASYRG